MSLMPHSHKRLPVRLRQIANIASMGCVKHKFSLHPFSVFDATSSLTHILTQTHMQTQTLTLVWMDLKRSVFRFCATRLVTLTTEDEWRTIRTDGHSSASWTITTIPSSSATNTCTPSPASTDNSRQIMITRYPTYDWVTNLKGGSLGTIETDFYRNK